MPVDVYDDGNSHLLYVPTPNRVNAFRFAVGNGGSNEMWPGEPGGIDNMASGRVTITASASSVRPHFVVTRTTVLCSLP